MKDILPLLKPKKINSNKIHLGPCSDGGYVINEIVLEHCSALFTYGVAQDYRYELDFNEKYKKPVYMFDHTVDHDLNGPLFFFKEGLGFTENCKDVIEHYNKNNIPGNIYLKIDTEGAEYDYFSKVDIDRLASFTDGICLEVHSLGNENCRNKCFEILTIINKHFTLSITSRTLKFLDIKTKLPNVSNYNTFFKWLTDLDSLMSDLVVELKNTISSNKKTEKDVTKYKALTRLNDKVKLIIESWNTCKYVITKKDDNITVTPLYISTLSSKIFKYGKKILLMSATIIDPQDFAKTLGIEKYKFIETKSPFSADKSPIYISSKYKLNYKSLQENLPKVANLIQQICDEHGDEKGVIHTHTSYITEFLKNKLSGNRFQYRYEEVNNEKLIQEHIVADYPSVLVSPSITHGVDLKDDLARFQIIVKLPYMPLGDERIKTLFEEDSNWYTNKMLSNLVQACGRGVRSQDDWCITYILDGGASNVIQRSKTKLPKFFVDRVQ